MRAVRTVLLPFLLIGGPLWAQAPLLSSPVSGTHGVDAAETVTVAWNAVTGAKSYMVEVSETKDLSRLLNLKDATVEAEPTASGQTYDIAFADDNESLKANQIYYWRVKVVMPDGQSFPSEHWHFTTAADPFKWLADRNIAVTRAEDGVDKDKPATLSFIRKGDDEGEEQYIAEFLATWEGKSRYPAPTSNASFSPSAAIAGKLTNDSTDIDTLAKISAGVINDIAIQRRGLRSIYQSLNASYEGDQEFESRKALLEYLVTFSSDWVGQYKGEENDAIRAFFRPYVGIAYGKNIEVGDSGETKDQIYRIVPQVDLKFRLNFLSRAIGISNVLLSLTDKIYLLPNEERDRLNFFTASIDFEVAKGFTAGLTFNNGYDAPKFEGVNNLALTFGFKVGG